MHDIGHWLCIELAPLMFLFPRRVRLGWLMYQTPGRASANIYLQLFTMRWKHRLWIDRLLVMRYPRGYNPMDPRTWQMTNRKGGPIPTWIQCPRCGFTLVHRQNYTALVDSEPYHTLPRLECDYCGRDYKLWPARC